MADTNAIAADLKTGLDTALSTWVNLSYDYEVLPAKISRTYILFAERGAPAGIQTVEQGWENISFLIILFASHENTAATMQAAEQDINDMTDAVFGYLQTAKNQTLWTNIRFITEWQRLHHPDLPQSYMRGIPFRVITR